MIQNKVRLILLSLIFISGCITDNQEPAISIVKTDRVYSSTIPAVNDSEFEIVKSLFNKYKISLSNLKVTRLVNENNNVYIVHCAQYYIPSGTLNFMLEYFSNDIVFSFNENIDQYTVIGELIDNLNIKIYPKVTMEAASNLFYSEIKNDWYNKDLLSAYSKGGFNAELGIYDLNAGRSYVEHNFVLAWRLTTNNGYTYPLAYIRADYLELITYSNGVIIGAIIK